jgi:hypothetical protein
MMSIYRNLCHYPGEEEQQNEERRNVSEEHCGPGIITQLSALGPKKLAQLPFDRLSQNATSFKRF